MSTSRLIVLMCTTFCLLAPGTSPVSAAPVSGQGTWETTLQARDLDGNATTIEAYYDTTLDISWVADANLAFTSGFDADGRMAWADANTWAANLSVNGVTGWRLPTLSPVNGMDYDVTLSTDGTTDRGNATTTTNGLDGGWRDGSNNPVSEMGHLFYVTLGNLGRCDPALPSCTIQPGWGLVNTGPFTITQLSNYWSDTQWNPTTSWDFNINAGSQNLNSSVHNFYAWAVYDGDVGEATIPGPVDLTGTIKTENDANICAMVLASGQFMFSCDPVGVFSLTDLAREQNGTVKRQIYADGFFPKVDVLPDSIDEAVVMTRSGTCPSYNTPYDPAVVPGSAGERINISGKVLLQDSQTPICAMVLANGQFMFSCDGSGSYALNIPLDTNGQFKLQVYADGFAPTIQTFDEFQAMNDVRMARAVECAAP